MTAQVKHPGQVVYCFFGDGASKQGAFFESLNMAAVWKLPIVYVLENNQYQAYTHYSLEDANAIAGDPLSQKAQAFSIPGVTVDGTDALKVRAAVKKGRGPRPGGEGAEPGGIEVLPPERAWQCHYRSAFAHPVSGARGDRGVWQSNGIREMEGEGPDPEIPCPSDAGRGALGNQSQEASRTPPGPNWTTP